MSRLTIVIHPAVDPERLQTIQGAAPDATFVNAATSEEALAAMPDADGFLGKITPPLLAASTRLRWVQSFTASLEHYIFPELVAHPCVLTNARGLFGDVIAEQVMGYVLSFSRNLHIYVRRQVEHRYEPVGGESGRVVSAYGPGEVNAIDRGTIDLGASTMGVVGYGGIGQEVARKARVFDLTVRALDRFPERFPDEDVWGLDRLEELIAWSDFLVIAAPHTPETERLFDRRLLAKFRPTGYLINVGRGAIVVLDDLVAALRSGTLAGAALDVFEIEPLPSAHALWDFPNVIITPHTAGYSTKIPGRHLAVLVENAGRFARGEPLINVVDKAIWC